MSITPKPGWLYEGRAVGEFGRGHFCTVMGKDGELWLIDTAVLRSGSMKQGESRDDAAIRRCIELSEKDCSYTINATKFDYYYGEKYVHQPLSNGEVFGDFEPICDLHEMRGLKPHEDERWFSPDDCVRGVHLYREHGYSWTYGDIGVAIVKKDAKPMLGKQFDAAMYDWHPQGPDPSRWRFDEVEKRVGEMKDAGVPLSPVQQVELACAREQVEQLSRWREEHEGLCREWNRRRRHAWMFRDGDAFEWDGEVDGSPEWFLEAMEAGDIEVEYEDERGKHLLLNKLSDGQVEELADITSEADCMSVPPKGGYCVYRTEEYDEDGSWTWRYGIFEREWR